MEIEGGAAKRFWARHKPQAVPRLLRGEDIDLLSRELGVTQTKRRTSGDHWLQAPYPENFMELSAADAARLDFKAGDAVKIVLASNTEGVWDTGCPGIVFGQPCLPKRSTHNCPPSP